MLRKLAESQKSAFSIRTGEKTVFAVSGARRRAPEAPPGLCRLANPLLRAPDSGYRRQSSGGTGVYLGNGRFISPGRAAA